jgi:hypothetical protein
MSQQQQHHIKLTAYSGIRVYELTFKGIPIMRRLHDNYINATQILRAAGLAKPQRTKILEKDISKGKHEKVQGGYAGFQGTWIPPETAMALAGEYELEGLVQALLDKDVDPSVLDAIQASPVPRRPTSRGNAAHPLTHGEPSQGQRKYSETSLSDPSDEGNYYTSLIERKKSLKIGS